MKYQFDENQWLLNSSTRYRKCPTLNLPENQPVPGMRHFGVLKGCLDEVNPIPGARHSYAVFKVLDNSPKLGQVRFVAKQQLIGTSMEHAFQTILGDSRRISLPASLCQGMNLRIGETLLIKRTDEGLVITPLRQQAEKIRQELKAMIGSEQKLNDDLNALQTTEVLRETDYR